MFWMIDGMIVSHFPYGPTAYFSLHNVVLRHDIKDQGTVSEAFPHLIFENFNSKLGARVSIYDISLDASTDTGLL
jgi:U3 small nucleolar ribonucleoprotein protein IMP4